MAALAVAGLVLSGCGGGGSSEDTLDSPEAADHTQAAAAAKKPSSDGGATAAAASNTLVTGLQLRGFPHAIDIYRPAGATRAIVFLHGTKGRNFNLAYSLGLNKANRRPTMSSVDWNWLTRNKVMAVFPQGQALPSAPIETTWTNHRADSGEDDVAFLNALSSYIKHSYAMTDVALAGHSAGGLMTNRMWCEATASFNAYVSLSGPAPGYYLRPGTPCTPSAAARYMVIIGGKDSAIIERLGPLANMVPSAEELSAGLVNQALVNELIQHQNRSQFTCGETPTLAMRVEDASGSAWRQCHNRTIYRVVDDADHPIASLELHTGRKMADVIAAFSASR